MKAAVVHFGGRQFLCPSVEMATKFLHLLSKVVEVDWDYVDGKCVYKLLDPEASRDLHVELKLVDQAAIVRPLKRVEKARRLGPGEPLLPAANP